MNTVFFMVILALRTALFSIAPISVLVQVALGIINVKKAKSDIINDKPLVRNGDVVNATHPYEDIIAICRPSGYNFFCL